MRMVNFRAVLLSAASMCLGPGAAFAANLSNTCSRGPETRVIEVLTPGKVGQACDLNVIRDNGAYRSTPY
ncbi:MAG: hypothetical protein ABL957_14185, partial [Parvularculaceae bacterium]